METIDTVSDLRLENSQKVKVLAKLYQSNTIMVLQDFFRKIAILFVSVSLTNKLSLISIGLLNRLLGRPIRAIFLIYPGQEKYARQYVFSWSANYMRYNPLIVGAYFQKMRIGLIVAAYVQENYFRGNKDYLIDMHARLDLIRRLVGAEVTHMAGTLPSEMNRLGLIDPTYFTERCELVSEIVIDAERKVREKESIFGNCPVLLLGGKGSIGTALKAKFLEEGREVHVVDREEEFPPNVIGQKSILIDVSRKGVLESRLKDLWSGLTVLNESYPEPESEVVRSMSEKGINVYHVAGVKAKAYPAFQYGYAGGIPCCAANRQENMTALIKKL